MSYKAIINSLLIVGATFLPAMAKGIDILSVSGKTPYVEEALAMKGQFRKLRDIAWNFRDISGTELPAMPKLLDQYDVVVFGREHNTWEKAGLEQIEPQLQAVLERSGVVLIDTASVPDNRWFRNFPMVADLMKVFAEDFIFHGNAVSPGFNFPNPGAVPASMTEMRLGAWRVYGENGEKSFYCAIRDFSGGGTLAILPRFSSPELLENLVVRSLMRKNGLPEIFSLSIPPLRYGRNIIAINATDSVRDCIGISFCPENVTSRFSGTGNKEHMEVSVPASGVAGALLKITVDKRELYRKTLVIDARPLLYLYPRIGVVTAGDATEIRGIFRSAEALSYPLHGSWELKSAANGVVFDSGRFNIDSANFAFMVKTPDGGVGRLCAELKIDNPAVSATCEFDARTAPGEAPVIKFRSDRTMVVNDVPIFPVWGSRVDNAQVPELAAMGFNFITDMKQFYQMGSRNYNRGDEIKAGEFLGRYGMKKMAMLNWVFSAGFGKVHGAEFGEKLRNELPLWYDDPNILIYYLMDEPAPATLDTVAAGYRMLKEIDPSRPVAVCLNHLERPEFVTAISKAGKFADIIMVDPYPFPYRGIDQAEKQLRLARELIGEDMPLMYWMQGFAYSTDRSKKDLGRYPTRDELRCEAFLAICHGARGLGLFTMTWLDLGRIDLSRRAFWNAIRQVIGEIKEFSPMLLSEIHRAGGRYGKLPLHTFQSCLGNDLYLVVVNSSVNSLKVRIQVPGIKDSEPVDEYFESRLFFPENSVFMDTFSPLGVHVYRILNHKQLEPIRLSIKK